MSTYVKLLVIGASMLLLLFYSACDKNPTQKEQHPPVLPPAGSMSVDFSVFAPTLLSKAADTTLKTHFFNAALRVAYINAVVILYLTPPVAVFAAAISQQPVLQSDGKFHWIYQVTHSGQTFQADLAGYVERADSRVYWEMVITAPSFNPPLNRFLWFDGWATLDNTQGQWLFYDQVQPPHRAEVIQLDWTYHSLEDRMLIFTNVSNQPAFNGDRLEYKVLATTCSIKFYDRSENATTLIVWDSVTTAGFIQAPNYNNGQPAYWDEHHYNVN